MGNENRQKKSDPARKIAAPSSPAKAGRKPDGEDSLFTGWGWGEERLGDSLAIGGIVGFLFICMILPLVGKAGVRVAWSMQNHIAFAATVTGTLALAALASASKWKQMKAGRGGMPKASLALTGLCVFLLVALAGGWLSI